MSRYESGERILVSFQILGGGDTLSRVSLSTSQGSEDEDGLVVSGTCPFPLIRSGSSREAHPGRPYFP